MRKIKLTKDAVDGLLDNLLKRSPNNYGQYTEAVNEIVEAIKAGGDAAVFAFARFAVPRRLFRFGGNRSVKFRLLRFLTHICALPGCS